jgi:hypothetical protein
VKREYLFSIRLKRTPSLPPEAPPRSPIPKSWCYFPFSHDCSAFPDNNNSSFAVLDPLKMHCYHQSTGKRQTFSRTNLGTVPSSHDVSYILANQAAPLLCHVHICFLALRLPHFGCLGSWRGKCERANKQKEAGLLARSKPTARCIMWNPSMLRHKVSILIIDLLH